MFLILDLQPNAEDQARGLKPGLGATTMAINGAIGLDWTPHVLKFTLFIKNVLIHVTTCTIVECGQSPGNSRASLNRQKAYKR